jgi:GT2 family glycosyltransferase
MSQETEFCRPDLSIVIVNWNTRDYLSKCLHSLADDLQHFGRDRAETFVVDNASTDDSVAMLNTKFDWVKVIENDVNVGFARANNQAIMQANGRTILLLNSDTEVVSGALATLVNFLEQQPDAGVVGARLLNADGTLQPSAHPAPTLFRELWYLLHFDRFYPLATYDMDRWPIDQPHSVEVLKGACMLFRSAVLDEIGLLDEDYFMYSEEVDLCQRTVEAGWELYWEPRAVIVHYGGRSTQQVAFPMFMQLYKSKILYFRKRHGELPALAYKVILALAAAGRVLITPLAWLERQPSRARHLEMGRRYWRLLTSLPTL